MEGILLTTTLKNNNLGRQNQFFHHVNYFGL